MSLIVQVIKASGLAAYIPEFYSPDGYEDPGAESERQLRCATGYVHYLLVEVPETALANLYWRALGIDYDNVV